jgi:acetyltransferase-like isoleucine patch superfamily enzyme
MAARYRLSGAQIGDGCSFEPGVKFQYGWRTSFGTNCIVDAYANFKCPTEVTPFIGHNIDIGNNVFIGCGTIIDSNLSVKIGRDTFVAPYCFISDTTHNFSDPVTAIRLQGCHYKAVEIGEDVWLGAHVIVLAGVKIGRGCVIGANSVVTHDLPPYVVAVGAPARIIRRRTDC